MAQPSTRRIQCTGNRKGKPCTRAARITKAGNKYKVPLCSMCYNLKNERDYKRKLRLQAKTTSQPPIKKGAPSPVTRAGMPRTFGPSSKSLKAMEAIN